MDELQSMMMVEPAQPVDKERLLEFDGLLEKYKSGKKRLESRVVAAENWWKLRNVTEERKNGDIGNDPDAGFRAKSGWLHNVITSKHADAMENYPEPIILPREPGDREQAKTLSDVLPCILEQNHFEETYDKAMWQKLKTGTCVYQVRWDTEKAFGQGDIAIECVDLLTIFWEPGVTDIQKSRYLFHVELQDNEVLELQYPQLKDKLKGQKHTLTRYMYDDSVDTTGKSMVIDVYYKVKTGGQDVLHYCKYVGDEILYSTENAGQGGIYDHGLYPFVFDALWPIEGSPCGYGYVDLCQNPQTQLDMLDTAFTKNALVGATPRYFVRTDGGVNEKDFLNLQKPFVKVSAASLDEMQMRVVDYKPLGGTYLNLYDRKIDELRQTSGNTETANGVPASGVTAASAIAALQEASGKTSRDMTQASYRAYSRMIEMCIELIRQFYTTPRTFRITGDLGQQAFAEVSNAPMLPREVAYGSVSMGTVTPLYDIKVRVQKRNAYTRTAQNELALQLYSAGFFAPEMATAALACLDMMDFEGKDDVMQHIAQNGTLLQMLQQTQQLVLALLQKYEPEAVPQMAAAMGLDAQQTAAVPGGMTPSLDAAGGESGVTAKARQRAASATEARG